MSDLNVLSERVLRGEYAKALAMYQRPAWLDKIATIIPNAGDRNRLPWIGGVSSGMRERTSGGSLEKPNIQYVDADVVEYEDGVLIPIKDIRRDKLGVLNAATFLSELARHDAMQWEELVLAAIAAGASTACYDTQYFFDTDHADADGPYTTSQDNDLSVDISAEPAAVHGSTTAPSPEELTIAIGKAVVAIMGFKDNMGKYVNRDARSFVALLPASMWMYAVGTKLGEGYGLQGLLAKFLSSDSFQLDVIPSPLLSSWTASLAVFRADTSRKALVAVEETLEPEIARSIATPANSDRCRAEESYEFRVRANRRVKYGDWRQACYVTLA